MGSTCDYKYIGSFLIRYSIEINWLFFLKYQSFFSVLSCPSSSSPSSTSAKFVYHFGRSANQKLSRWIYQTSVKTQHFKNKSQNLSYWDSFQPLHTFLSHSVLSFQVKACRGTQHFASSFEPKESKTHLFEDFISFVEFWHWFLSYLRIS